MEPVYSYFKPPSKFAINNLFYTDGLGFLHNSKFYLDRKKFRNNIIMYVLTGTLYVEQNGIFKLQEGDSIVLRMDVAHKFYTDPMDVAQVYWMHFADKNMPQLFNFIESQVGLPYQFRNDHIKGKLKETIEACKKGSDDIELIISRNIYTVLTYVTNSILSDKDNWQIDDAERFKRSINQYMEKRIYHKVTLEELARHCNISKYHFCKLFKKHYDCTPMQYFNKLKIKRSQMALIYTSEDISKIAQDYGFSSQSHYTKLFKEFTGVTPKVYRKNATF